MTAIGNLVQQTTTSEGTGNLTLVTSSGRQSFNGAFGTGGTDAFYYFIMHRTAAEWEVGTGHLLDATTLVRDTVINSSNADAAVSFSAGTKDVTNAVAASDVAQLVNLASTANGRGASLIGIEDSGALIAATTVEGALAEIASDLATNYQPLDADLTTWAGITPGTGVGTALAVNVGTAGAFVVNGGALGTPSSGTLTNATGLPISTGVSGLGPGVATFLATPSSANLASAVTGETGSGALVFGTSPGFTTSANPASDDGATLGTTSLKWSDLFLANGAVINFNSGDVTITHSAANTLTFAGASSGYVFADAILYVTSANPRLRLTDTDASGSYFEMTQGGIGTGTIFQLANTGQSLVDIVSLPADGTSAATVRLFRSTNTTGSVSLDFCRGNGTATVDHRIASGASGNSYFAANGGNVGIGTTSPSTALVVVGQNTIDGKANTTALFRVSDTTTVDAALGVGSTNGNRPFIAALDGTTPAASLDFYTGADLRMRIDASTGNVGIGTTSPSGMLHVDQSSTTAAVPVLYLDQADVSEEMIQFETTIGTGNAIEAVGAKTLTTTHFIKVTIPGGLTRYIPVGTIA